MKRLPCSIGDTVYWKSGLTSKIFQGVITAIKISRHGIDLDIMSGDRLTKRELERVFFTRESALQGQ